LADADLPIPEGPDIIIGLLLTLLSMSLAYFLSSAIAGSLPKMSSIDSSVNEKAMFPPQMSY
ncbi:MAG: hypothetical protein ACHQX1_03575, partial [Candidatus Micrarchaeales archaeon]